MAMAFPVVGSSAASAATPRPAGTAATPAPASGFGDALNRLTKAVDASTGTANTAVANMLDGSGDVHEAMIALQQAETTLQLTVQMRNKFVQAYQDIMRMPV